MFEFVSSEMPEDDPGWLELAQYAEAISFIFSEYGLPTGDEDLPIERAQLEAIIIEGP